MSDEQEEISPADSAEQTASLLSSMFCSSLEENIKTKWCEIAGFIAEDPETAARLFDERTVELAVLYIEAMSLFVKLDQRFNEEELQEEHSEEDSD